MEKDRRAQLQEDLRRCGQALLERGMVWGRSGNISARLEPDRFLISAAGSNLGFLRDEDIVLCRVEEDGWDGPVAPSIEAGLHRRIYQACGDTAMAVVHSQPFYATLVACSAVAVGTDLLPETMAYLGKVARIPYHHAGSRDLAEAAASTAPTSQVLLLENHGVVCWGPSLDDGLLKTETLELLCRLLIISRSGNVRLNYLGDSVVEGFRQHLRSIGKSA